MPMHTTDNAQLERNHAHEPQQQQQQPQDSLNESDSPGNSTYTTDSDSDGNEYEYEYEYENDDDHNDGMMMFYADLGGHDASPAPTQTTPILRVSAKKGKRRRSNSSGDGEKIPSPLKQKLAVVLPIDGNDDEQEKSDDDNGLKAISVRPKYPIHYIR